MHDERGFRDTAGPSRRIPTALVVLNDRARGSRAVAISRAIGLLEHAYRVRIATPPTRDALQELVADAPDDLVVAVGGDGTVNAVATALPSSAALGVLPAGSANDFAAEVGIPRDPLSAAAVLVAAAGEPPRPADLVAVNGQRFCTVGGLGLVAQVTDSVTAAKERSGIRRSAAQLLGGSVYKLSTARMLLTGRDLVHGIDVQFREPSGALAHWSGDVHALFVVNHGRCGGGLTLPTGSSGSDGVFELGIVVAGARGALVANFARLSAGARVREDAFVVRRATEATIRLPKPMWFAADGELLDQAAEFTIGIEPGAFRLLGASLIGAPLPGAEGAARPG